MQKLKKVLRSTVNLVMAFMLAVSLAFLPGGVTRATAPAPQILSVSSDGVIGNRESGIASYAIGTQLSDDAQVLVFASSADNLVPGFEYNGYSMQVYARNLQTGVTELASVDHNGFQLNSIRFYSLSPNGRYVAFDSSNRTGEGGSNYFVRDLQTDTTALVPFFHFPQPTGVTANDDGTVGLGFPDNINTPSGSFGAFSQYSPADNNLRIYRQNNTTGEVERVDIATNGTEMVPGSRNTSQGAGVTKLYISDDGSKVAFEKEDILFSGERLQLFVHDFNTGETRLVSRGLNFEPANERVEDFALASSGESVAFASKAFNMGFDTPTYLHIKTGAITHFHQVYQTSTSAEANPDVTAPVIGVHGLVSSTIPAGSSTNLNVKAADNESGINGVEYFVGSDPGQGNGTPLTGNGNDFTASVGSNLPVGINALLIRAKDVAGNWSAPISLDLEVTQSAPVAPTNLAAQSPSATANLAWDAVPQADHYNIYRDSTNIGSAPSNNFADSGLADGSYQYYVTAVNSGGQQSDPSNAVAVLVDAAAPTVGMPAWTNNPKPLTAFATVTLPVTDNLAGLQQVEYFVGATDPGLGSGTTMALSNQQTNTEGAVVAADATASFDTSLPTGIYQVTARAKDAAGNWSLPVTDYLVVFDAAGPTNVTASKKTTPQLANGDVLPGLLSDSQNDKVNLGFDVSFTPTGMVNPNSVLNLNYETGHACNSPNPNNCHSTDFTVNTTLPNIFNWLTIGGSGGSVGTFQGQGTLVLDGTTTANPFKVEATDGSRATPTINDDVVLRIYAPGANPDTTPPLYQLHINLTGNWVKIQ